MKKFTVISLALVMALLMAITAVPAFAAGETAVSCTADRATVKQGEIVTYTVAVGPVENLGTLRIQLPTDDQLAGKQFFVEGSVQLAEGLEAAMDAYTLDYADESRIFLVSAKNGYTSTESTKLLTFQMMVAEDAAGEVKTALNLADGDICDANSALLAHTLQDAVVTVEDTVAPEEKPEQPEVDPEQPDVQPEQPEVKPEQPEVQPDVKPDVKPEQPEGKPEVKPVQPEGKPEAQPTQAPAATAAPAPAKAAGNATATGDTTNMTLWIVLAVVALAAIGGGVYYQKKKK